MRLIRFPLLLLFALGLSGCLPRGESKSIEELMASSKERFNASQSAAEQLSPEVKQKVQEVSNALKILQSRDETSRHAAAAADADRALSWLVDRAGYTSRPSIAEIAAQYRVLAGDLEVVINNSGEDREASSPAAAANRIKLLVARTYSLVASELETTKFAVGKIT